MTRTLRHPVAWVVAAVVVAAATSSPVEKPDDTKVDCPDEFFAIGTTCYYYSTDFVAKWDSAVALCEEKKPAEGGTVQLAVFGTDLEKYSYVADYIRSMGITRVFLGLSGPGMVGEWTWIDGTPMSRTSIMWGCSQPIWDCGGFSLENSQPGPRVYLNTFDCDNDYEHYLCEYIPPS